MTKKQPITVDDYIAMFDAGVQVRLNKLRKIIKHSAPDATETISYKMPTFKLHGKYLVYFAAFKNHIGFYPFPTGVAEFKEETKDFVTFKGTIQFPYDKQLPVELIRKIVKFRAAENLALKTAKK
jgi:uncharacterized protein YdhG (YjbR/CyaY superfamily)